MLTAKQPDPLRSELFFGAVYGLGLSSLIWAAILFPPAADSASLGLLGVALFAGLLRPRVPVLGRVSPVLPVALASLLLAGLAAGVVAAAVSSLAAALSHGDQAGLRPRRAAFRAVAGAMAAFVAGLVYLVAGGSVGTLPTWTDLAGLLGHGIAFMALQRLLLFLAATHGSIFSPTRSPLAASGHFVIAVVGSPAVALPLVLAYGNPELRSWVLLTAALLLAYRLGNLRAEVRVGARVGQSRLPALKAAITRTLIKAIVGGDPVAKSQLWRDQGLCLAVGERLELDDETLDALGTAALLRDVGKNGVSEQALDKPDALTTHELDSIRLHPRFGAELLAGLGLSDRVCAIVRQHHERWDGRGYPEGLHGEQIPIEARILAAADHYNALTSQRPFRRAVPASEARKHMQGEAGKMFDPDVVEVLLRLIGERGDQVPRLVSPLREEVETQPDVDVPLEVRLPLAQQQLTTLYDLERMTRYPIDLDDCLSLAGGRIAALVPHRSLAVYLLDEATNRLRVAHAAGQGAEALREITLAPGERLSGWAVRHQRSIIGGERAQPLQRGGAPSDLEHSLDDPRLAGLASTLAAPLVSGGRCLGVITLYDGPARDFTGDERRRLVAAAGYVARAVLRARRTPQPLCEAMTDRLTGLPDGRFLMLDAAERLATTRGGAGELGFLAFQVSRTTEPAGERFGTETAESGLCQIARRLAEHCQERETLARFGPDTFVVLCPLNRSDELLERWNGFTHAVEKRPLDLPSQPSMRASMVSAHATFPADGDDLESVLSTLEDRLCLATDRGATVVPFRSRERSAG